MSDQDPIEQQLQERLAYTRRQRDFCRQSEPIVSISLHSDSLARECAALRRLCGEAEGCELSLSVNKEVNDRLRAAAAGEGVL